MIKLSTISENKDKDKNIDLIKKNELSEFKNMQLRLLL